MKTHCALCRINLYKSWFASLILFSLMLFTSCYKEGDAGYLYEKNKESVYPALLGGQDLRIKHVIQELRAVDHGTNLARKFAEAQAHPLWEHAILADKGIDTLLFVPVRSDLSPREIRTIWVFQIHGDTTFSHRFYHRNRVSPEEQWRFDYFTTFALGQSPKDGLRFTTVEGDQIPRALVPGGLKKRCIRWAAYLDGDPNPIWHTRCWEEWEPTHHEGDADEIGYPREDENNSDLDRRELPVDGDGGGGGIPNPSPAPDPLNEYFDKIDKTKEFEGSRTDSMYKKLESVGDLLQILQEGFVGDKISKGDLKLVLAHLSPQRPLTITLGQTRPRGRVITVTFDVIFMKHLYEARLAATVLHEMVHAWVYLQRNTLSEKELKRKYPDLVPRLGHEGFMRYKEKFIDVLFSLYGSELTKDQCEALFWEGLEKSEPWEKLDDSLKTKFQELGKGIKNRQ
ncbi:MAG: hypothetical protein HXN04_01235 [Porphyromonadaceae bacterium]|nr:hypothetical protein [Porphyromonadaceae bacterium]